MPFSGSTPRYLPPWGEWDRALADQFEVPFAETDDEDSWILQRQIDGSLALRAPKSFGALEIKLDLQGGDLARRLKTARPDQPLPRAVGRHRSKTPPRILDATAGLGRDAFSLAAVGCQVHAIERVTALAVLVADAARRAALPVTIECTDAIARMHAMAASGDDRPDVVYLDPMFEAQGRAQVKKEMQVCRLLDEECPAEAPEELLAAALPLARGRVVVKRHRKLPPLLLATGRKPSHAVPGDRVRFDVYLTE